MARHIGSVCRLCRREGEKLFLKGERCFTPKCAVERRESAPGVHGKNRGKFSEYKQQLREKQKIKRIFGMVERPFRNLFKLADKMRGVTGENMLKLLESRLDNMVQRSGFAASKKDARQLVSHGHVLVNGKVVNIASFKVKVGDTISIHEKSRGFIRINEALNNAEARKIPEWIELSKADYSAKVRALPTREQMGLSVNEQLVVELYSK